jgi:hypothetical protein
MRVAFLAASQETIARTSFHHMLSLRSRSAGAVAVAAAQPILILPDRIVPIGRKNDCFKKFEEQLT